MKVVTLEPGTKGFDTVANVSLQEAQALYSAGFRFAGRYLTGLSNNELAEILQSGLACTFFSYANSFDPSDEIAALKRLAIPIETVVWLDVEGVTDDAITLQARINTWARALKQAGYIPGMYAGAQQLLTSKELYDLSVNRYMKSCSRVVDRHNQVAEPTCGWCMVQCACDVQRQNLEVDVDFVFADYTGRSVAMVVA
jgi:hypothetical protein